MFLTVDALSKELGVHPESIRNLARSHKLPAGKLGGSWVFIREDVENAIRANYDEGVRVGLHKSTGDKLCESMNETAISATTFTSAPSDQTENEYENLLRLPRGKRTKR